MQKITEQKKINPITMGWVKAYKRVVYSKAEWLALKKDDIPFVRYLTKCLIIQNGEKFTTEQELEPVTTEFGGMVHAFIKKKVNYGKGVNQPKKYGKCFITTFKDDKIVSQKVV